MVTEFLNMPRLRQITVIVVILILIGFLLLFRAVGRKPLNEGLGPMFDAEPINEDEMSPEEKRHRDILKEGKVNIPELGLNFIEDMEHNKKATTTTPKPTFTPGLMVLRNPPVKMTRDMPDGLIEEKFFKYLETKDVICKHDDRVGFQHDGGWNVCFSPPFGFHDPCIVYSFGIGNDWRFDRMASKFYNCTVYSFDPSIPYPREKLPPRLHYFPVGIGGRNGKNTKGWQVKTLSTLLRENGHENTVIEYLKFDIEYMEWIVLENLLKEKTLKNVKQIGFEIHTNEFFKLLKDIKDVKFNSGKEDFIYMFNTLQKLEDQNFRQFNYRMNPFGFYSSPITRKQRSCCYELHFLNMNFVSSNHTTTLI